MELRPGDVIAGKYRAVRRVGAGSMGEVWAAERMSDRLLVAAKMIKSSSASSHELIARFNREAYLLKRIQSDYVARVLDFAADDVHGRVLVMDFVEGEVLARLLARRRLTVEEAIELGKDLASALVDLHASHVVHRDLKPGNIILRPMPDRTKRAIIVDFGVSRLFSDGMEDEAEETLTSITRANVAVGTIEYMAPEQVLNAREVTGAADIYALGAILFRAAMGRHVFLERRPGEAAQKKLLEDPPQLDLGRDDEVARRFARVVIRALQRLPEDRYRDAADMLSELDDLRELSARLGPPPKDPAAKAGGAKALAADATATVPPPKAGQHASVRAALKADAAAKQRPEPRKVPRVPGEEDDFGDEMDDADAGPDTSPDPEPGGARQGQAGRADRQKVERPAPAEPALRPETQELAASGSASMRGRAAPRKTGRSAGVPPPIALLGILLGLAAGIVIGRLTAPALAEPIRRSTGAAPAEPAPAVGEASPR